MINRFTPALLAAALAIGSCAAPPPVEPLDPAPIAGGPLSVEVLAESAAYQWTGLAVSRAGRTFVSFPRWPGPHAVSVAQLRDGVLNPYPDAQWNSAILGEGDAWVCVQSVVIDSLDRLWVLDPASPNFAGVVRDRGGGPKIVRIDLATDRPARVYHFDALAAPDDSYLNDVRIDTAANVAYITDSGAGAIVVLDLVTGAARRTLARHPCTKAELGIIPVIDGAEVRFPDGSTPRVNADGLALDTRNGYLYFQPLSSRSLYRVPTRLLNDFNVPEIDIERAVEPMGRSVMTDGMEIDPRGRLYFSAIELNAVVVRDVDGTYHTLARDEKLVWPDSFAWTPDRELMVTCSQIHRSPLVTGSASPPATPYTIVRIPAAASPQ